MSKEFTRVVNGVTKSLEGMLNRANLIDGYLDRVVYPMYQNLQRERWASENATQGSSWPSLQPAYAEMKLKRYADYPGGGTKMMIATKRLFNSVVGDEDTSEHEKVVSNHSLQIFSTTPYAEYANVVREFKEFSVETMREIMSGIVNYITRGVE
jgi:hypothetical protein